MGRKYKDRDAGAQERSDLEEAFTIQDKPFETLRKQVGLEAGDLITMNDHNTEIEVRVVNVGMIVTVIDKQGFLHLCNFPSSDKVTVNKDGSTTANFVLRSIVAGEKKKGQGYLPDLHARLSWPVFSAVELRY